MPYALNNAETGDAYKAAAELQCPNSVRVNIHVFNAGIFFTLGSSPVQPGAQLTSEIFRAPGLYSMDRPLDVIRFRSSAVGKPARVTCDAWRSGELSG